MLLRYFTALLLVLTIGSGALAQQQAPNYCGYTGMSPWLDWYHQHKHEFQNRGADTAWLYVPMTIHIVGNNAGFGYYPQEQAFRILCELNEQYADARIRYYLMPGEAFVYHNNTSWYEHDWSGGSEMINTTKLPDRVNAYIVADPAGNCGYSWHDAIVMGKGCSATGNSTWAHEAGHHLSLPHPFYGWEGFSWNYNTPAPEEIDGYQVEKTDTSNCYISGDRFCDTRPDYLNFRWACDGNQQSVQLQKDPLGNNFRSDASLIMGYSYDACSSRFTEEQIAAMRANLRTQHVDYLQTDTPEPGIPAGSVVNLISPIDSQSAQYNNAVLTWEAVPNATHYSVQVALSPNFPFYLFNSVVYNTTSAIVTKGIPNNRVLYWRVRAFSDWDPCGTEFVQTGVFKTKNLTATNDLEKVALVALAPNPVLAGLPALLTVNSDEKMEALLLVTDAAGRQCHRQTVRLQSGDNQVEILTNGLNAGFYLVTLQNEKGIIVKRMVVSE